MPRHKESYIRHMSRSDLEVMGLQTGLRDSGKKVCWKSHKMRGWTTKGQWEKLNGVMKTHRDLIDL